MLEAQGSGPNLGLPKENPHPHPVSPDAGSAAVTTWGGGGKGMKEDVTDSCQRDRELYFGNKHLDFAEA